MDVDNQNVRESFDYRHLDSHDLVFDETLYYSHQDAEEILIKGIQITSLSLKNKREYQRKFD